MPLYTMMAALTRDIAAHSPLRKRSITPQQWIMYAGARQIAVGLPESLSKKQIWNRYHLDFQPDEEISNHDWFWGSDARSCCGLIDPEGYDALHELILFPYYYAKWNPEEFKRLLEEADSLRPEWGDLVSGTISRVKMPSLLP